MKHLMSTTAITPPLPGKTGPREFAPETTGRSFRLDILRLLLAGLYFLLGSPHRHGHRISRARIRRPLNRTQRHDKLRDQRLNRTNNRSLYPLRKFMAKGLTPNQFNERCTRLSHMGRFQIYDWRYYRWEFWRPGAIAQRCKAPQGASGPVSVALPLGLSAAHLGPD
jgi:hypothetical protein